MSDMDKYANFISNQQKTLESDGKLISEREVLINRLMAEGYTLEQIKIVFEDADYVARMRNRVKNIRAGAESLRGYVSSGTGLRSRPAWMKTSRVDAETGFVDTSDKPIRPISLFKGAQVASRTTRDKIKQSQDARKERASNILNDDPKLKSNLARQAAIDVPPDAPIVSNSLTSKNQTDAPKPVFSNTPPASPSSRSNVNAVFDKRLVGKNTSDAIGGNPPEPAKGYEGGPPTRVRIDPGSGGVGRFVLGDGKYTGSYALPGSKTMSAPVGSPDPGDIDNIPKTPQSPKSAAKSPATPAVTPAQGARAAAKPAAKPAASQSRPAPSAKGEYGPSGYDPNATREREWKGNKLVRKEKPEDFRQTVFNR